MVHFSIYEQSGPQKLIIKALSFLQVRNGITQAKKWFSIEGGKCSYMVQGSKFYNMKSGKDKVYP